jgi:hypothetical protein
MRTGDRAVAKEQPFPYPSLRSYALCYGLYAVLLVLCYEAFWIWRGTIEVVLGFFLRRSPAFGATYLAVTLLAGLILFAVAIAGEVYLREGLIASRGSLRSLLRRFARLAGPLALSIALAFALQEFVYRELGV